MMIDFEWNRLIDYFVAGAKTTIGDWFRSMFNSLEELCLLYS